MTDSVSEKVLECNKIRK